MINKVNMRNLNKKYVEIKQGETTIKLSIENGVWNPTPHGIHLGNSISSFDFTNKKILELGCGCGNHGPIGGGSGTSGQGFNGGTGSDRDSWGPGTSGGGGGAGGAGGTPTAGVGAQNDYREGTFTFYGGGGGGAHGATSLSSIATGGTGGGGGTGTPNGTVNTGGGGAAMSNPNGLGGSGIVVIRYDINQVQPAP